MTKTIVYTLRMCIALFGQNFILSDKSDLFAYVLNSLHQEQVFSMVVEILTWSA